MKKCPFCAEEIKDEAIKCRYCQSFLSAAPSSESGDAPRRAASEPGAVLEPAVTSRRGRAASRGDDEPAYRRKVLYTGSPSWRAFFRVYFLIALASLATPIAGFWITARLEAPGLARLLAVAIPLFLGFLGFLAVHLYRKSRVFRVTTTNIESEYGLLSRKIDVLELWRCRDIRYQQSLADRILGIAHIEIFTADHTTPELLIAGLPASRQLFERIRDSIEIQRQARNVVGFVD